MDDVMRHKRDHYTSPEKEIAWAFFYAGLTILLALWLVVGHAG